MKLRYINICFALVFAFSAAAQEQPHILTVQPLYGGALSNMSANGEWAVGDAVNPGNSSVTAFPRLVNTATGETKVLFTEDEGIQQIPMGATCVSNDGLVAAGSYYNVPAVWKEGEGWSALQMPDDRYNCGLVSAMTPDGKYAVGRVSIDLFREYPCMWDLASLQLISLPGMIDSNPRYKDMIEEGGDPAEWTDDELNIRLTGITPDARFILGMVDFAFPAAAWEFLYDRESSSWIPLGMKYEDGRLSSLDPDIYNVDECVFSADGSMIGGTYYSVGESSVPFSCLTSAPGEFTGHPDGDGYGVWAIGSDGVIYGSTPLGTPVRDWSAKVGRYWYDWKMVMRQLYGIDWMADVTKDDLGLSGTVGAVSADNLKILATDWAQNISYILTLPAPMAEICNDVDLLGDYRVFPPEDAEFSMLQTVVYDFGRNVEVKGAKTAAFLEDSEGNRVRASINIAVQADNSRRVEVIFRNFDLDPGKVYTVVLPAGTVQLAGDQERSNREIRIRYRGREAGPVRPVSFSPAEDASVARINITTNPVIISFNASITAGDNPDIRLYQIKDGEDEFLFPLNASVSDRQMIIYPLIEQRLAYGSMYRIEVGEGTVTDLSATGGNEPFSVTYKGSYVPEIDPSSNTIFFNDFSLGVADMMLMEGDGNTPSEDMQAWGFEADNTPWIPVCDDDDTEGNYAAASHSSYSPAGKSDDWMVTPQLFIPDDKASLSFKSQGYRLSKRDMLKVYVWPCEDVVTVLTPSVADKIRYDGDMLYYQLQNPGENEEILLGDWTENHVDLSAYAGKYIYIAFVNDNQNQSAVFVDDVLVSRQVPALISIDIETAVVDADEVSIAGRILAMKETGLDGYSLTLSDFDGKEISTLSSSERVECGEMREFEFPVQLSLEKGERNIFNLTFTSGGESIEVKHEIDNLLFETTKRVVLEEMTGTTCQFCPQGILGVEYLQEVYGDLFIPVAIHSYTGDSFGSAEASAYSGFLGLSAAPTGSICRGPSSNPMYFDNTDYVFSSPDGNTWLQQAEESLRSMAEADVNVRKVTLDASEKTVNVDMSVRFAVNRYDANVNIFGILMEDALVGVQTNGLSNYDYPGLGEWGKGGSNGKSAVLWYYDDVVRATSAVETGGVFSGFNGKGGYLPAEIKAGETYDLTFSFRLPSNLTDAGNTKVCVMLIDANTGRYINADVHHSESSAVDCVVESDAESDVFDLTGRLVLRSARPEDLKNLEKGIYIHAGRKYIVK